MPKYIFRIDDVHEKMDYENFKKLTNIFLKYKTPVVLCIIPANKDPMLVSKNYNINKYFRRIILLRKNGALLVMHGVFHTIKKGYKNYFQINNFGEFGYDSYRKQYRILKKGKEVFFKKYGLFPTIFCAPAHSYNPNTFKALKALGFKIISDGVSLLPYKKFNLTFFPQLFWFPLRHLPGVQTIALHPQKLNGKKLKRLSTFIQKNKKNIITFNYKMNCDKDGKDYWLIYLYCLFCWVRKTKLRITKKND